jgi:hypothetical protein
MRWKKTCTKISKKKENRNKWLNEFKENTRNQLNDLKENTNKQLNEIRETIQDMKWKFNRDIESLKKNQIEARNKKLLKSNKFSWKPPHET